MMDFAIDFLNKKTYLNSGENPASKYVPKPGGNTFAKKIVFEGIYSDNQTVDGVTVLPDGIVNENQ